MKQYEIKGIVPLVNTSNFSRDCHTSCECETCKCDCHSPCGCGLFMPPDLPSTHLSSRRIKI